MYALTIASGLDRQRYQSLMCALDEGGALEPEIKQRGIPCFIMHRRQRLDLKLMWRMYQLFRQTGVTVIQTHHFNQLFYSLPGALLTGMRIIHTEHSVEAYGKPRLRTALRLMSRFCHKVVAIGNDGESFLREQVGIPASRLMIIRGGIDPGSFTQSRSEARAALGLSADNRVAVIIARLYPEKNHLLLLAAFAKVVRLIPQARLLIAGAGTELSAIEAEIVRLNLGEYVQVLGVRRDVARLLAAADLFVLSSDREGLPIAVLEAMAAQRPVVATAVGDLPDVVENGKTGRIVPPGNVEALAEAISEIMQDQAKAHEMGARAAQAVVPRYTVSTMLAQYEKLFSS